MRGTTPLQQQQRDGHLIKDDAGQAVMQQMQETLQIQQALRSQTPQSLLQQQLNTFQGISQQQHGQQTGHARQSSRYTFTSDNLPTGNTVNARGNAAHMAEQLRMMPPQQQIPHQLAQQMYGGAPGLGASLLGSVQQPPPGLKSAPTPPAPGLGGIPMGNMPGNGQFSGMGHHHSTKDNENVLLRELLAGQGATRLAGQSGASLIRGADGKRNTAPSTAGGRPGFADRRGVVDLVDPSILQARVAQPQHQMQHLQGIQAGGHSQGGYNPGPTYYATPGRW